MSSYWAQIGRRSTSFPKLGHDGLWHFTLFERGDAPIGVTEPTLEAAKRACIEWVQHESP